eukprot:3108802-Pleurochrysis_carterae.AAC.1
MAVPQQLIVATELQAPPLMRRGLQEGKGRGRGNSESMAKQPPENRDQWSSLNAFHSTYQTADAVPVLPLLLTPPVGQAETQNVWTMRTGMP